MNNLGVGGEAVQAAGDAVIEAHSHGHQDVAGLDRAIGERLTVHSAHSQAERMRFGNVAGTEQGCNDRYSRLLDELQQLFAGVGEVDAVSGEDQRTVGAIQKLGSVLHRFGAELRPRLKAWQLDIVVIAERAGRNLHVLADVDKHDAGPPLAGDVEGLFHDERKLFDVGYEVVVFADGLRNADHVRFLEGVRAEQVGWDLAGDRDDRHAVHLRSCQAGDKIGCARPARCDAYTNAAGRPSVAVGHVRGTLLVAYKDVVDAPVAFIFGQGVIGRQNGAARMAEYQVDPFAQERFPYHLGTCEFLRSQIVSAAGRFSLG